MMSQYTVRCITYDSHNVLQSEVVRTVEAASPESALTLVEQSGVKYYEAEVSDDSGDQVAVYGANVWRDEWNAE
jgi:hypothetical protein